MLNYMVSNLLCTVATCTCSCSVSASVQVAVMWVDLGTCVLHNAPCAMHALYSWPEPRVLQLLPSRIWTLDGYLKTVCRSTVAAVSCGWTAGE